MLHLAHLNFLDHLNSFTPEKKYRECVELLSAAISRGTPVCDSAGKTAFDVFDCTACDGAESTKPYCSQYSEALQFFSDWPFGKEKYVVLETQSKAMGAHTCYF